MATHHTEKRRTPIDPTEVGTYTPGIIRVEHITVMKLYLHDEIWHENPDKKAYQTDYNLLDHCTRVSNVMELVGVHRGRPRSLIDLGRTAGLVHDIGKIDDKCMNYRTNGLLSVEERAALRDSHMHIGALYLRIFEESTRKSDHRFMQDLITIVQHHHYPWLVRDRVLREITFDLFLADYYISRMESRHNPGLSQWEALKKLERYVEERSQEPWLQPFLGELKMSLKAIKELYDVDLNDLSTLKLRV